MAFQAKLSRLKHAFACMLLIDLKLVKKYTRIKTSKKYMKVNSRHPQITYIFGMFLQCLVLSGTTVDDLGWLCALICLRWCLCESSLSTLTSHDLTFELFSLSSHQFHFRFKFQVLYKVAHQTSANDVQFVENGCMWKKQLHKWPSSAQRHDNHKFPPLLALFYRVSSGNTGY